MWLRSPKRRWVFWVIVWASHAFWVSMKLHRSLCHVHVHVYIRSHTCMCNMWRMYISSPDIHVLVHTRMPSSLHDQNHITTALWFTLCLQSQLVCQTSFNSLWMKANKFEVITVQELLACLAPPWWYLFMYMSFTCALSFWCSETQQQSARAAGGRGCGGSATLHAALPRQTGTNWLP